MISLLQNWEQLPTSMMSYLSCHQLFCKHWPSHMMSVNGLTRWCDKEINLILHLQCYRCSYHGFRLLSLESSDVQKLPFGQHPAMHRFTVWTCKINGDMKGAAVGNSETQQFTSNAHLCHFSKIDFFIQIVSNLIVSWCSSWKDDCASPMHHYCNVHYSCVFYSVSISLRDDSYDTTSDKGHQASL